MYLPSITIGQAEEMSLLEIDDRVNFIVEMRKEDQRHKMKDLSCLIFYGVSFGYASTQSKKQFEKKFHDTIDTLLQFKKPDENKNPDNIEAELERVFKG